MNWPDPGTPPEHPSDAPPDAPSDGDDRHDPTPPAHGPMSDTPLADGEDTPSTPTYAGLRSEVDDDLGRWEAPEPSSVQDPSEPVPAIDPARPDRSGRPPVDVGVADDAAPAEAAPPTATPAGDAADVRPDAPRTAPSDRDGGGDPAPDAPGQTHEDGPSGANAETEASGFGKTAFSPHTGSWGPGPGASPSPEEAEGDHDDGPETAAASGHAEGEREVAAPDAVGGLASAGDEVDPGATPDASSGGPAFHGEHELGAPAAPAGAARMFHGERDPGEPAGTGVPEGPRSTSAAAIEDALSELDAGDRHATVICVANQKGGVGKTTTTVSLGAALAMLGAQILVVDLDPQGNATTGLGLRAQEGAPSTYRVIVEQMDVEDAAEPTAVRGLHVLPSSLDLAGAEIELVPAFSRENRLKQALDAVRDLYDVILIDCPPSLGLLTINALVAADQVLVPIQCEYYALEGLGQLMRTVKLVADSLNRGLGVGGVVLTMFDGRTNLSQQVVDEVQNYFGDIAYQTIVPRTVRLSEAPSYGQPIGVFDASSRGARAYERLAREMARRLDLELEEEDVSPLDRLLGSSPPPPEEAAPLPTDLAPDDVPAAADVDEGPDASPDGSDAPAADDAGGQEPRAGHGPGEDHQDRDHEHAAEGPHEQHDGHDHGEEGHGEQGHDGPAWRGDDQQQEGGQREEHHDQPHGVQDDEGHGAHEPGHHEDHTDEQRSHEDQGGGHEDRDHEHHGHEHHGHEHHDHDHEHHDHEHQGNHDDGHEHREHHDHGHEHHDDGHDQHGHEHHDEGHHQHDEPAPGTEGQP